MESTNASNVGGSARNAAARGGLKSTRQCPVRQLLAAPALRSSRYPGLFAAYGVGQRATQTMWRTSGPSRQRRVPISQRSALARPRRPSPARKGAPTRSSARSGASAPRRHSSASRARHSWRSPETRAISGIQPSWVGLVSATPSMPPPERLSRQVAPAHFLPLQRAGFARALVRFFAIKIHSSAAASRCSGYGSARVTGARRTSLWLCPRWEDAATGDSEGHGAAYWRGPDRVMAALISGLGIEFGRGAGAVFAHRNPDAEEVVLTGMRGFRERRIGSYESVSGDDLELDRVRILGRLYGK